MDDFKIPKGWFVYEAGQSPIHLLWFVHLVSMDDLLDKIEEPRRVFVEEKESFKDALITAISFIS